MLLALQTSRTCRCMNKDTHMHITQHLKIHTHQHIHARNFRHLILDGISSHVRTWAGRGTTLLGSKGLLAACYRKGKKGTRQEPIGRSTFPVAVH